MTDAEKEAKILEILQSFKKDHPEIWARLYVRQETEDKGKSFELKHTL